MLAVAGLPLLVLIASGSQTFSGTNYKQCGQALQLEIHPVMQPASAPASMNPVQARSVIADPRQ